MYEQYQKLRDMNNLKDADVARATGLSPVLFSEWKKGKSEPKIDKLRKLADFFGVTPNTFYTCVPISDEDIPFTLVCNEDKDFIDLFNKLDKADKDTILSNMRFLLEADKYKKDITSTAIS